MSKGYTKQEVQEWKGWAERRKEMSKKKVFKVCFSDLIEAESEEQCYERLLDYLGEVVKYGDVCGFDFKEAEPSEKIK